MSGVLAPRPLLATLRQRPEPVPPIEDPDLKRLTDASLNAARSAGAAYADVRLTHTFTRRFGDIFPNGSHPAEEEEMTFGVRVLVDGYWGFASSPVWTVDEAARLGMTAVQNAKANTLGKSRTLDLAPIIPTPNGHWTMPVRDDPFRISRDEIDDFLGGIKYFIEGMGPRIAAAEPLAVFVQQDKAFASSLGQYYTQRLYRSSGDIGFVVMNEEGRSMGVRLTTLTPAGEGFEYFRDQSLRDQLVARYEEALADLRLPIRPIDVGRYNVIFDAPAVAAFISKSIGVATELDRALGYEANAGGTSYITEPHDMVGSLKIGSSSVTVTANRSEPGSVATVQWDDEGVTPRDFTLVNNGILADMQTTREGAGSLRDFYTKRGQPVASHGCAYTPAAIHAPLTHCANLRLQPSGTTATFDSLIADQQKAIAFKDVRSVMDFQQMTGYCEGHAYEIKQGKRVAILDHAGIIFRTPELWNAVAAVGGSTSQQRIGLRAVKGQPMQASYHSVTAVPFAAKELTVIDTHRKA